MYSRLPRLLAVLLAASVVTLFPRPAAADTVFRAHTWNVAMGNGDYQNFNGVIARAVTFIDTYPAWHVSLQESCFGQADAIRAYLLVKPVPQSFTLKFGNGTPGYGACSPNGVYHGGYGNAVLAIGSQISSRYQWLTPYVWDTNPEKTEKKNIVCQTMQNFLFKTENCSTHTTAYLNDQSNYSFTIPQVGNARDVHYIWRAMDGAYSLTGSDLNLPYKGGNYYDPSCTIGVGSMPIEFRNWDTDDAEGHLPCWYITRGISQKSSMIDYVWADRRFFQQWGRYDCTPYPESDHRICPGVFRIP